MVKGLNTFRSFFKDYTGNYILIGGTACSEHFESLGLSFRRTKDLDIILVAEALNREFVKQFWNFIEEGQYTDKQKSQERRTYYRFLKPSNDSFPTQIELFSRNPDTLDLYPGTHLTPIPVDEDLSSLSAILMDDCYYDFVLKHSDITKNLHLAKPYTLICLKAKAFLDMQRALAERKIDEKDIKKHKNDIIRLAATLPGSRGNVITLPTSIHEDMENFIDSIRQDTPDIGPILKNMGLPRTELTIDEVMQNLIDIFGL